jgi:hypothetical protein
MSVCSGSVYHGNPKFKISYDITKASDGTYTATLRVYRGDKWQSGNYFNYWFYVNIYVENGNSSSNTSGSTYGIPPYSDDQDASKGYVVKTGISAGSTVKFQVQCGADSCSTGWKNSYHDIKSYTISTPPESNESDKTNEEDVFRYIDFGDDTTYIRFERNTCDSVAVSVRYKRPTYTDANGNTKFHATASEYMLAYNANGNAVALTGGANSGDPDHYSLYSDGTGYTHLSNENSNSTMVNRQTTFILRGLDANTGYQFEHHIEYNHNGSPQARTTSSAPVKINGKIETKNINKWFPTGALPIITEFNTYTASAKGTSKARVGFNFKYLHDHGAYYDTYAKTGNNNCAILFVINQNYDYPFAEDTSIGTCPITLDTNCTNNLRFTTVTQAASVVDPYDAVASPIGAIIYTPQLTAVTSDDGSVTDTANDGGPHKVFGQGSSFVHNLINVRYANPESPNNRGYNGTYILHMVKGYGDNGSYTIDPDSYVTATFNTDLLIRIPTPSLQIASNGDQKNSMTVSASTSADNSNQLHYNFYCYDGNTLVSSATKTSSTHTFSNLISGHAYTFKVYASEWNSTSDTVLLGQSDIISKEFHTAIPCVRVYDESSKTYALAVPYVYYDGAWHKSEAYVHNGSSYKSMYLAHWNYTTNKYN